MVTAGNAHGRVACTLALLLIGCAGLIRTEPKTTGATGSESGRERVLLALDPEEEGWDLSRFRGTITTLFSSGRFLGDDFLPDEEGAAERFDERLRDGTVAGGLLFRYDDGTDRRHPLWIASFGMCQSRRGAEAAKFHANYIEDRESRIPAHVALVDHPSSAPFYAANGMLSLGAYDDGRMWIELARALRTRLRPSSIHLFGVSMSGQTVVHALIEDRRLRLGLFDSGLAVSIAPDFRRAPGHQFALLPVAEGLENPWPRDPRARNSRLEERIQTTTVRVLVNRNFVAEYRRLRPDDPAFEIPGEEVAAFLRGAFERRLSYLRERTWDLPTWNPEFRRDGLEAYMATTRVAALIDRVATPLAMISSKDDPAVPWDMFHEVMAAARHNPWVAAYESRRGGHFGFDVTYGADYLGHVMRLLMDPEVLGSWRESRS